MLIEEVLQIIPLKVCIILHIIRTPDSIIVLIILFFLHNISEFITVHA